MINLENAFVTNCIVHQVGNKVKEESIILSRKELELNQELESHLKDYFFRQFKTVNEIFHFHHEIDLKMNEVYMCADKIFEKENFVFNSVHIAKHMFDQTRHFSIKSGEVFIALLNEIVFENIVCKGLGIFKSERKDSFLKITSTNKEIKVHLEKGISNQRLDKGCIILNDNYADGFRILTYENNNSDTDYWRSDFLSIKPSNDKLNQTSALINLCKEFSNEYVKKTYGKQEQVNFLDHSFNYISKSEKFNISKFEKDVFLSDVDRKSFENFRNEYFLESDFDLPNNFEIAKSIVYAQKKKIKNEIKLDTNVLIKLEGQNIEETQKYIEKGFDTKRKMSYYKLYFNTEK
jgi:hypothetical protein